MKKDITKTDKEIIFEVLTKTIPKAINRTNYIICVFFGIIFLSLITCNEIVNKDCNLNYIVVDSITDLSNMNVIDIEKSFDSTGKQIGYIIFTFNKDSNNE